MEQELAAFEEVWGQICKRTHWEWESALNGIVQVRACLVAC